MEAITESMEQVHPNYSLTKSREEGAFDENIQQPVASRCHSSQRICIT